MWIKSDIIDFVWAHYVNDTQFLDDCSFNDESKNFTMNNSTEIASTPVSLKYILNIVQEF